MEQPREVEDEDRPGRRDAVVERERDAGRGHRAGRRAGICRSLRAKLPGLPDHCY